MKNRIILIYLLLAPLLLMGQGEDRTLFSYEEYMQLVREHHPIAFQAELIRKGAELDLKKAKAGFDPKLYGDFGQKQFEQKRYYQQLHSGLKIPSWFGLEFDAGYSNNTGFAINPENSTPNAGLWHAGLNLQLGKGMFIDQRRAELKMARQLLEASVFEQQLMINQLFLEAGTAYWEWHKAYNKQLILQEALKNANDRFEGIKSSFEFGDLPAVDTLKASIQVTDRQLKLTQAQLELQNKKNKLEVFLWQDGMIPLELDSTSRPEIYTGTQKVEVNELLPSPSELAEKHPEIKSKEIKLQQYGVQLRQKRENLKPELSLKYRYIQEQNPNSIQSQMLTENYTIGAQLAYAPFTRKERADVKLTRLKIDGQQAVIKQKRNEIQNKIEMAGDQWNVSLNQLELLRKNQENYRSLLQAEIKLFQEGEGSLFLVNQRDLDYLESQLKFLDGIYANQLAALNYKFQSASF